MNIKIALDRRNRPAWAVLIILISATLFAANAVRLQVQKNAQSKFDIYVQEVLDNITDRMRQHEQILLGGVGLIDASTSVSRTEWHAYVERLNLNKNYPGIQGVGLSPFIKSAELKAHIESVRKEGFPQYTVRPSGERSQYIPITNLEPFSGRNMTAFGFDMMSEAARASAMRAAVDNNIVTITNKVKLVQETHGKVQAGLLMYLPAYKKGLPLTTAEERWAALYGFVYSPYRVGDLMSGIIGNRALKLDFSIFDGDVENESTHMYDSSETPFNTAPMWTAVRPLNVYGKLWTVRLNSRPEFEAEEGSTMPWLILILGGLISMMFFLLVIFLIWRRDQAEKIATKMTAALRKSADRLKRLLDSMSEGAYGVDINGICTFVNPSFLNILGFSNSDQVLGKHIHSLIHHTRADGTPYPITECRLYQSYLQQRSIHVDDEVFWCADGVAIPVEYRSSPIIENGKTMGAIATFINISERKRIEKMKAEFISTVSHELRTPLTAISGSLSLIAGGALGEIPAQAKQMIDIAYRNSQRLIFLINDLLDMEKLVAGKMAFDMQRHKLMPLLKQSIEGNSAYGIHRHVKLSLTETVSAIEVQVDSQRLLQVISNLLSNAIKYSPDDGMVEMGVQVKNNMVRVSITDRGPGIPAEFRTRIFQKFSQADSSDTRQKGGTGLGLAITRELVERMGGNIGFDSVEGQGSCFYFELPIASDTSSAPRKF